jgi:phosphoribosylamine--glycine ligase
MKDALQVAVIGGGGREHAVIRALKKSARVASIVAIPGNGGIARDAECVDLSATDVPAVVQFCKKNKIDYVVVTPDDPLALGMVDALAAENIMSFGPTQAAARIESSKIFSKNLMKKYHIPTAEYESFTDSGAAIRHARDYFLSGKKSLVIKADGLALGKGVLICHSVAEAEDAIREMMIEKKFGASGERIIIEEFLTGPEATVLSFCDGSTVVPMASSMDHKRALDGDKGLNTGGMGTIAPNPFYTKEIAETCMETIFKPTMSALQKEACPFKGCLYFGLMLTQDGPRVIEYNCRFGDPETQVALPLLETDLLEIMIACTEGRLTSDIVRFAENKAAACVVLASEGYPASHQKGFEISGIAEAEAINGVEVYCAGVSRRPEASGADSLITSGGRVLGVAATAETLETAIQTAYKAAEKITFKNKFYRRDIGRKALMGDK